MRLLDAKTTTDLMKASGCGKCQASGLGQGATKPLKIAERAMKMEVTAQGMCLLRADPCGLMRTQATARRSASAAGHRRQEASRSSEPATRRQRAADNIS